VTRNLSGSQCNLRAKEARRIHESLKSAKADTFANSRLAVDATWPPCSSPRRHVRARENHKGHGGRSRRTCRARATSNQAFVDVIIARKRAPSHRVFVAQVFGRNMWAKRRRRHHFSAFWLRSSVNFLMLSSVYFNKVLD
jgi:hypothetical protein